MKTLKKALSVVLALAMVLGMTVVASAATYPDYASVTDKEAVDVMTAVGVFQGGSDGKFNAQANLTRAQAAKLICYLALGEDTAEALPVLAIFSDVPATHWAAKYVAYLYQEGIVSGVGNNKFNPNGNVTGYEFGKMLLGCLGYDAAIEGFVGSTWQINVAKVMKNNDVAKKTTKSEARALTREEAARYCLNTLCARMVEYEDKGTEITINGAVIKTGASKAHYVYVAATNDYAEAIKASGLNPAASADNTDHWSDLYVELGEDLYDGDLELDEAGEDSLGRTANEWTYDGDKVGTYAAAADETVVIKNSVGDDDALLLELQDVLDDEDLATATNLTVAFQGGDVYPMPAGTVVELTYNDDDEIEAVVAYLYAVFEVTDVDEIDEDDDDCEKYGIKEEYTLDPKFDFELDGTRYVDAMNAKGEKEYDDDSVVAIGAYEEDDFFMAIPVVEDGDIVELLDIQKVNTLKGKVTALSIVAEAAKTEYVKVDGKSYVCDEDNQGVFDFDAEFVVYTDVFGSVIFAEEVEAEKDYKYAYVNDIDADFSKTRLLKEGKTDAAVELVLADGTVKTFYYEVVKASKAYGTDIAKGDYYAVINDVKVKVIDKDDTLWSATTANAEFIAAVEALYPAADGAHWVEYALNDDGLVTLKELDSEKATVAILDLDEDDAKCLADGYYATGKTELVVLDTEDGLVKTVKGYKDIAKLDDNDEIQGEYALIVFDDDFATKVYVLNDDFSDTTKVTAAVYAGIIEQVGDDDVLAKFYVDGKAVEYKVATDTDLTKGAIVELDVDEDNVATMVEWNDATPDAVEGDWDNGSIDKVSAGEYIYVGGRKHDLAENYKAFEIVYSETTGNFSKVKSATLKATNADYTYTATVLLNADGDAEQIFVVKTAN